MKKQSNTEMAGWQSMMRANAIIDLIRNHWSELMDRQIGSKRLDAQRKSTLNPPSAPFSQAWEKGWG